MSEQYDSDLFGNKISSNTILREKYIEPPFSVIDGRSYRWHQHKRRWLALGIQSELGRDVKTFRISKQSIDNKVSVFDPVLCEMLYKWFCPGGGVILDPFAGGSVRGIVAHYLGYKYIGIDIRNEQIQENIKQAQSILNAGNIPHWICGDSNIVLDDMVSDVDFVFSCPPYGNLERYSDLECDISNMEYPQFLSSYRSIINKSCKKIKHGGFACFVVGEIRDKNGNYYGFVPDTIRAFTDCGMKYYNEAILLNPIGTAAIRAEGNMKSKKLVKTHQNVLVFKKI